MGSADHQFNLAELLTQNYNLQEGCAEAPQCPEKPEEELHKDFIDQVWGLTRPCPVALPGLHVIQPWIMCTWFASWPSLRACSELW